MLLVDDLITTGGSAIEAIEAIRSEGGQVKDMVVLIDREQGGVENLKRIDVKVHAYSTVSEIARKLLETELINEEQYRGIIDQTKSELV